MLGSARTVWMHSNYHGYTLTAESQNSTCEIKNTVGSLKNRLGEGEDKSLEISQTKK